MRIAHGIVRHRWWDVAAALAVFACAVFGTTWAASLAENARMGSFLPAAVAGAGALGMAVFLVRFSAWPRWGWFGAAAVFLVLDLASAAAFPEAPAWRDAFHSDLWMQPWLFLVVSMGVPSGPASGWCSPSSRFAGWMLIGVALVLGSLSLAGGWI